MITRTVNNVKEALAGLQDGMTVMLGGFGLCGIPETSLQRMGDTGNKGFLCG